MIVDSRFQIRHIMRLFLGISLFVAGVQIRAAVLDVYVLTGQSNALGTTELEGSTPAQYGPGSEMADATTLFFWSNVNATNTAYPPSLYGNSGNILTTLKMQQGGGNDPEFWGPEFGFARRMAVVSQSPVMIIKVCRGGGGNTLWDKDTFEINHNSGHMWGHLRDTVDAGLTAAENAGYQVRLRGLLYIQGESNNIDEAKIADRRLSQLITNLKEHVNAKYSNAAIDMKTVIGEIAAYSPKAAQILTTNHQRALANRRDDIVFVQTHDLPLKSDKLHFGRDAKLLIGRRLADALCALHRRSVSEDVNYAIDMVSFSVLEFCPRMPCLNHRTMREEITAK